MLSRVQSIELGVAMVQKVEDFHHLLEEVEKGSGYGKLKVND